MLFRSFVLYGGTAIALRYGHRISVDFDFFRAQSLDRGRLSQGLAWLPSAQVLQDQPNTLTVLTPASDNTQSVKVSFFGGLTMGRVANPQRTSDGVALVASPLDLLATKLKVLLQRAERKDYEDVAILLRFGLSLPEGLGAARALYGDAFPISECLKALVYFADGDLGDLPPERRQQLESAVLSVDSIPCMHRRSRELCPVSS